MPLALPPTRTSGNQWTCRAACARIELRGSDRRFSSVENVEEQSGREGRATGVSAKSSIWSEALDCWRPSASWASTVGQAAALLERDPADVVAWANLAMALGDSGETPLALVVCMHATHLAPRDSRIAAHRNICLMQLGLAVSRPPGPIPIARLGARDVVVVSEPSLEEWLARALEPFDGHLGHAADWVLRLALARTGLRPDEPRL